MKRQILSLFFSLLLATSAMADVSQSFKIPQQTGTFTVRFSAVPSAAALNAGVGFGPVELSGWADFNCILQFADNGFLKVRNGTTYASDVDLSYIPGRRYYVQMNIDVVNKKYDVIVWPYGGTEVKLATGYNFRADNYTGAINYFSTRIVPADPTKYIGVSDFQIGNHQDIPDNDSYSAKKDTITGDFFVRFAATPSHDSLNGSVGLSKTTVSAWADFAAIIRFGNNGKIDVRNGGAYAALADFYYQGGKTYMFYITGNTTAKKYTVKAIGPKGDTLTIARDYTFRSDKPGDTLNYLSTRIVEVANQGGKPGSYISVDGFESGVLNFDGPHPVTNRKMEVQKATFKKMIIVTPSHDSINGSVALNQAAVTVWADFSAIVRFGSNGKVDVRNGGAYAALKDYFYKAGVSYTLLFDVDVATNKYSVFIKKSPHENYDTLALNYGFRKTPVTELNTISTKVVWDGTGKVGGYLKLTDVGVTLNLDTKPFVNKAPTVEKIADFKMYADDAPKTMDIINITDGDGGIQTLTLSASSSDPSVATVSLNYTSGSKGNITLTPVAAGTTTISITLKDNGGTANGGLDVTVMSFVLTIEAASDVRDFTITTADGQYGADNRILGGKDCPACYQNWLQNNTGVAQAKNDTKIVNIPPRFNYSLYMRFDLNSLPSVGNATAASFQFYSNFPRSKNQEYDSIVLYALEDGFFPTKDFQGNIDQELDEFYSEGNQGGWYDIYDETTNSVKAGFENWITADNAPGYNEGNEGDLNQSWDFINHDVLSQVGDKYTFPAGDTVLSINHTDLRKHINEDENGVIVLVLTMLPNANTTWDNQALEVFTGEDYGREPRLVITWDKNAVSVPGQIVNPSAIKLYPNPAKESVMISNMSGIQKLQIRNMVGQTVMQEEVHGVANYKLNVSSLSQGVYFIEFRNNANSVVNTSKMIIK